jgi:hypothetical protein
VRVGWTVSDLLEAHRQRVAHNQISMCPICPLCGVIIQFLHPIHQ